MEREARMEKYLVLCHAMQSGVALLMEIEGPTQETSPKHLRVGVNNALAGLLIEARVITLEQYELAIVAAMEREVKRYEEKVSMLTGKSIMLA